MGALKWKQKERPLVDRRELGLPDANVLSVAFHPNGTRLATASLRLNRKGMGTTTEDDLELWDTASGQLVRSVSSASEIHARHVATSPKGKLLWGSEDEGEQKLVVRVWTLRD